MSTLSLDGLTTEQFRQRIAGLVDPNRTTGSAEQANMKEEGIRFLSILGKYYALKDEQITKWGDIRNVVLKSIDKLGGSPDVERLINDCLEGIGAESSVVVASDAVLQITETLNARDDAWRSAFVASLRSHLLPWIALARKRFAEVKEGAVEL